MGYGYKSKETAVNGVYLWLQDNKYVKVTKNTQFSQDKSWDNTIKMMKDYLKLKEIAIPTYGLKKKHVDHNKMARIIQTMFANFAQYIQTNYPKLD